MKLLEKLVSTLRDARQVLILTGAGMSAESGVPTFRDAQTGLWQKFRAEDLATPEAFSRNPRLVWDWYAERRNNIQRVEPHAGHLALVEMERYFEQFLIVTQNVDSLHQRAGSTNVVELHGNIMRTVCSLTGNDIDEKWLESNPGHPPVSPHHPQGMARPAVVWFGEQLPQNAMDTAIKRAAACDVCFSIGTSSLVQPAASLPYMALDAGASVIEINPSPTPLSSHASISFQSSAAGVLTAIASELGRRN